MGFGLINSASETWGSSCSMGTRSGEPRSACQMGFGLIISMENVEGAQIAIDKLIEHGLEATDVKKLQDAGIDTFDRLMKETMDSLNGIQGLSEAKIEKICVAAEKILISPQAKYYVEIAVESVNFAKLLKPRDARLSQVMDAYARFFNRCYSVVEMADCMEKTFQIPYTDVKIIVEDMMMGKVEQECYDAYMKDAEMLSRFRNAKKNSKQQAGDGSGSSQTILATQENMMQKQTEAMDTKLNGESIDKDVQILQDAGISNLERLMMESLNGIHNLVSNYQTILATQENTMQLKGSYDDMLKQIQRQGANLVTQKDLLKKVQEQLERGSKMTEKLIDDCFTKKLRELGPSIAQRVTKEIENQVLEKILSRVDASLGRIKNEINDSFHESLEEALETIQAYKEELKQENISSRSLIADQMEECLTRTMHEINGYVEEAMRSCKELTQGKYKKEF